jgi:lysophospholipase L1-like esterase
MPKVYSALGGSMSIDDYPIFDLVEQTRQSYKRVGAASLFFRNNDSLWPEFAGRDLASSGFDSFEILAQDGARMPDVLGNQLPLASEDADLVTLTIGGNDLLHILEKFRTMEEIEAESRALHKEYEWMIDRIHHHAPKATIMCTSVYDPTDGTGQFRPDGAKVPINLLYELNEAIEKCCEKRSFTKFADVCKHFSGHGTSAVGEMRWFWSGSVIEPSARGASEIRRVWLEALEL